MAENHQSRRASRSMADVLVWAPGAAVALAAGVVTSHGLYVVARAAGVPPGVAWLYPLITDGLALVAYSATRRLSGPGIRYAWSVVVLAAGLSGLAQALLLATESTVAAPTALRFGVGAWPAVAAAVTAHLLHLLGGDDGGAQGGDASQLRLLAPVGDVERLPPAGAAALTSSTALSGPSEAVDRSKEPPFTRSTEAGGDARQGRRSAAPRTHRPAQPP